MVLGLTCFLFFRMEFVAKKVYCVWMKKNGPSSCSTCFFSYDGLFMNANDYTMHHWPWNSKSQKGVDSKRPGNMQRIFNQVSIRLCSFEVNGTSRKKETKRLSKVVFSNCTLTIFCQLSPVYVLWHFQYHLPKDYCVWYKLTCISFYLVLSKYVVW